MLDRIINYFFWREKGVDLNKSQGGLLISLKHSKINV
jgi:hypothetical protein